ncbi:NrfD/PsrC family molybdoenzyme membrane anchor subunit, partial [Actinomadura roseirufa]|uniref:NrfD/PsrC family molybdoenzyme membrane anchor subunit n=1 Tax=Actinomadura roseirufa TaxID=2094049 RepID=UPI0013F147D6
MSGKDAGRDDADSQPPTDPKPAAEGEAAGGDVGTGGAAPGGDARPGTGAGPRRGGRGRRGRGRRGERAMVPEAEFTSYYGKPVLNPPTWKALDIAGYFFLGGLAGAGSVLAAGAHLTGRPATARAMKISSLAALGGSTAALVHDLGRPSRFHHMLRVVKPTSPMSMGSWLLLAYGPAAGAAAVLDVTGLLPRLGTAATAGAAALGPAVAAYTAVLAADTAVPAWHEGHRELPFVFTGSAAAAAAGMA